MREAVMTNIRAVSINSFTGPKFVPQGAYLAGFCSSFVISKVHYQSTITDQKKSINSNVFVVHVTFKNT